MIRIQIKGEEKNNKFFKFGKENGANYYEEDEKHKYLIWYSERKSHNNRDRVAIRLRDDGCVDFGHIIEECMNYEPDYRWNTKGAQIFIIEKLNIIQKYKK
jgi:hypothetical protein